ncbi:MAG TPA: hypothetical protein VHL79_15165 [Ramlibacter sp.]|jgi:hypothetical protein|nr:hypothetical protein [Ramlibacter sp.]
MNRRLGMVVLAAVLAGCGGGVDVGVGVGIGDEPDDFRFFPARSSGRAGSVTVLQAQPNNLINGVFSSRDVLLSEVLRFRATSTTPETCRFVFGNLPSESGQVAGMTGEVRYLPNSTVVHDVLLNLNGQQFRQDGSAVRVDRVNSQVVFEGLPFLSTVNGVAYALVLRGTLPIRTDLRDPGC